jgi:predicted ester cyclase
MTRGEILSLLERRQAALDAGDAAALAKTHAEKGVAISPTGGVLEGRAEIERVYRLWFSAFAGMKFVDDEVLIDGDRVVQIARLSGKHTGDFFGLAPTGRRVEVQVALLMKVADGLVVEERRIYDFTGVLVKVGVLKAKPVA